MRLVRVGGLSCFLVLSLAGAASATVHYLYVNVSNTVPAAPYATWDTASTNIQMAIAAASSGDEIRVGPGRYRISTPVDIPNNKRLTLRSTQSRAAIIDAQRLCTAVTINGTNSVIEGFTVQNGKTDNYGGGVVFYSSGIVRDCRVVSNEAYGGAGIMIYPSTSVVERCTIERNLATEMGGGVVFYNYAAGLVNNSTIRDNIASNFGGGVHFQGAGTVSNSWIADNRAVSGDGGGVAMGLGGRLVNSIIVGNRAGKDGGGVRANFAGYVAHCTVVSNTAARYGGGLFSSSSSFWNSILYFNSAPTNANVLTESSSFNNCCLIPGPGGSNFTNAPTFVNFAARDFHLAPGSSCIERGSAVPAVNVDYDGIPRPQQATVAGSPEYDVGAYEYQMSWDAGYQSIGNGWRRLVWFGDYIPMGSEGWIWHNKHGFFFVPSGVTSQSLWLYAQDMGWLWTGSSTYPFLYRAEPAAWLWYNGATHPRWFLNFTTSTWESRP